LWSIGRQTQVGDRKCGEARRTGRRRRRANRKRNRGERRLYGERRGGHDGRTVKYMQQKLCLFTFFSFILCEGRGSRGCEMDMGYPMAVRVPALNGYSSLSPRWSRIICDIWHMLLFPFMAAIFISCTVGFNRD